MKILIVTPGRLPVPAVKGGAVESLVELLLKYNEKCHVADLYIVSVYDDTAVMESKQYKHAKFYYVHRNVLMDRLMHRHILPYRFFDWLYAKETSSVISRKGFSFDRIVIENELVNGWVYQNTLNASYIYHAHNDTLKSGRTKDIQFLQTCNKVITISDYLAETIQRKTGAMHLQTVWNGIDVSHFCKKKDTELRRALRTQYHIAEDAVIVLFAGRLVPEKGIEQLLKAFVQAAKIENLVLFVTGSSFFQGGKDNSFTRRLKQMASDLQDRIVFSGYIDHDRMPDYYSMADIGCVPSVWDEPFGLTVIEQMAMELPVITTDAGAIPEIMDSSCGYVLPRSSGLEKKITECLLELARDSEKRSRMGVAGREKVIQLFQADIFCQKWFRAVMGEDHNDSVL